MTRYVALIRGINVGGNNLIKMADLKACFERGGLKDVATYIQSGNVLFCSPESESALSPRLEAAIKSSFKCQAAVCLRTQKQMEDIVRRAPAGFGKQPDKYRYDVIYLLPGVTAAMAMKSVKLREGVDQAHAGTGVLYFSRLISKASQSLLSKLITQPVYKSMTIRNWNTTTKLLDLMRT
jgi:uncharacterized protein (DUF1697 family)